ncbi:hypothetical protein B0T24DRAFT_681560 [Lasiosphaeria ovina]|uniref:Uncharacterized protein n=1 Tax=Lasiosphaeria ovina TaxID=92902 RepID=A0AAE0N453_9PEZI|nr:hypothetical protein B0T24DRAFT_681560 [Lasiosphaeria ovina]
MASLLGYGKPHPGIYHTWAIKFDRRDSDWTKQRLIWYRDGAEFYAVTGA